MSSVAQIEANRANAQHSTGPQSEAGINTCKYNATRHGLTGKQIVVKGEDPAAYDALRAELITGCAPASEREAILVEEIAQNWWRRQRALRVEAQVLEKYDPLQCVLDPEARKAFTLITRYANGIQRNLDRARRELDKLQKARKNEEGETVIPKSAPQFKPQPVSTNIGSVSQPAKTRHPNEDLPLACRL